ncbi:DUF3489 domain-containing protein [uncultured Enterovirga sp.]|uniref:DUF3489 domain-containing protein n=1 Tax=uncultured Enterovirga sp. TaxID=2026352 RepID=UPI0035C9B389
MTITLAKTETKLLRDAAARGGTLQLPDSMKPNTRHRTLGKLEAEGLIAAGGQNGSEPQLSPAGYRAVGLRPPRRKDAAETSVPKQPEREGTPVPAEKRKADDAPRAGTKRALLTEMLGRQDGASLHEMIAATGWLPHTTRAALSRIRSAGQMLAKSTRPDGKTVYRLESAPVVAEISKGAARRRGRTAALADVAVAV